MPATKHHKSRCIFCHKKLVIKWEACKVMQRIARIQHKKLGYKTCGECGKSGYTHTTLYGVGSRGARRYYCKAHLPVGVS